MSIQEREEFALGTQVFRGAFLHVTCLCNGAGQVVRQRYPAGDRAGPFIK